ncbi:hypothetical protein IE077_001737 [Cardiosporidium cionae]|uniref:Aspergillus nuclease S(1) n=1 Tax=Cardiosporidium cionae TaxID=476202 RepID=A0ABQ7J509_9APIC|nr:hypothetical protein IE077_001737 [Cardiosporidium cionae]|eukprot:KAF8819073.1 hypothetical protein IE077_001737 [Cardiosporidium cionae]
MKTSILSYLVILFAFFFSNAEAWWDEGHMLISAIARQQLTESELKILQNVLKQWDGVNSGNDLIDFAAVWPDHLKCSSKAPYCSGLSYYGATEVFNTWHYVDLPYNPGNITLDACSTCEATGSIGGGMTLHKLWFTIQLADKHPCNATSCPLQIGSTFTWNFLLRMFLHIFGDLHQPLHCVEGYSHTFPHGAKGGNSIHLKGVYNSLNLHALFDSAIDTYKESWPKLGATSLDKEALKLIETYPISTFSSRIPVNIKKFNINKIVAETHALAVSVYEAIDFKNLAHKQRVNINSTYAADLKTLCAQQITLGGYRLGKILKYLVKVLPNVSHDKPIPVNTESIAIPKKWLYSGAVGVLVLFIWNILSSILICKRRCSTHVATSFLLPVNMDYSGLPNYGCTRAQESISSPYYA